jgi:hypothetical protein
MAETYLDVGDLQAHEAFLPAHHKAWGDEMPIDAYRVYLGERLGHAWAKRHVRSLVLRGEDGAYLSSLRLYGARALHGQGEIWLGGIAEVLTPESLRGRGHASRLLGLTLELLKREGVDGAYLFSDIDPAFYARFGFVTIGASEIDLPLDRLPGGPTPGGEVRPRRPEDWEMIRRVHRAGGSGEPLWFLREEDQWDYLLGRWPGWARYDPGYRMTGLDCVMERRGSVVGYAIAIAELDEKRLKLLEFGMDPREEAILTSLLSDLRRRAEGLGCSRFNAPWPPGSWGALFRERFDAVPRKDGILMIASLSSRFDVAAVARDSGFWETDHV